MTAGVPGPRDVARLRDLDILESVFARGRRAGLKQRFTAKSSPAPAR